MYNINLCIVYTYNNICDLLFQSRKGRVSRKELRKIIEKFTFRLDEDQFKQLMLKLDPYHTNSISYQEFLDLFEETDGPVSVDILYPTNQV